MTAAMMRRILRRSIGDDPFGAWRSTQHPPALSLACGVLRTTGDLENWSGGPSVARLPNRKGALWCVGCFRKEIDQVANGAVHRGSRFGHSPRRRGSDGVEVGDVVAVLAHHQVAL